MSRLQATLAGLRARDRKAVIPYIVAGDPSQATTVPLMHTLVEAGADVIELGVPFSDPMAEGPVIQLAHERALAQHMSLVLVLQMVAQFRETDPLTPVVLMGYANPIEAMGYAAFAERAAAAGVDGVLTVDMPPEEITEINTLLQARGLDSILLISPTTSPQRIAKICARASGYIYYVSLKGVTGAANLDVPEVAAQVAIIKQHSDLPVCVGFGIKNAASARAVAAVADGVVIGSVLVNRVAEVVASQALSSTQASQQPVDMQALAAAVSELVKDIASGANTGS